MKKHTITALILAMTLMLTACSNTQTEQTTTDAQQTEQTAAAAVQPAGKPVPENAVEIALSDSEIKVDGNSADGDESKAVYVAHDIIYYEDGKDFTYGEGTEKDAHSADEASAHTVVHISQPGTYSVKGILSKGQIAIDLGEDAEENPDAVVNLILNDADITCDVAPAVIFYNVYECGEKDEETASKDVDTSAAGANVFIADGTENNINGSYVARIYKPDTVELSDDGTEVADAKKLHKYDGAFYSKMSMNVYGDEAGTGVLNINAANEGMDSELHLTINGGNININSGNDGINTNEDNISVTTINGGAVNILINGETGEGDGIDSNGWLVINGGTVLASACSFSADAGIDSDKGIHINGGTVIAAGSMLDRIEDGGQNYAVFNFKDKQDGNTPVMLTDENNDNIMEHTPTNDYSVLIYSGENLKAGEYTLWSGDTQLGTSGNGGFGMGGRPGMAPGGERPEMPEGMKKPENMEPPEGMGKEPPEGMIPQMRPDGNKGERPEGFGNSVGEASEIFEISDGANMFGGVAPLE